MSLSLTLSLLSFCPSAYPRVPPSVPKDAHQLPATVQTFSPVSQAAGSRELQQEDRTRGGRVFAQRRHRRCYRYDTQEQHVVSYNNTTYQSLPQIRVLGSICCLVLFCRRPRIYISGSAPFPPNRFLLQLAESCARCVLPRAVNILVTRATRDTFRERRGKSAC